MSKDSLQRINKCRKTTQDLILEIVWQYGQLFADNSLTVIK